VVLPNQMSVMCVHNVEYVAGHVHRISNRFHYANVWGVFDFVLFSASCEYDGVLIAIYWKSWSHSHAYDGTNLWTYCTSTSVNVV